MQHTKLIAQFISMTVPVQGENPLLEAANNIGLSKKDSSDPDSDWTPDKPQPRRKKDAELPSVHGIMATFGRAAGGKGITGPQGPVVEKVKGKYGFHPDGTPRDIMELTPEELEQYKNKV